MGQGGWSRQGAEAPEVLVAPEEQKNLDEASWTREKHLRGTPTAVVTDRQKHQDLEDREPSQTNLDSF